MQTHQYTYQTARNTFLKLAGSTGQVESIVHPESGPDGEIAMDIALWGEGERVLVISSGTHGIEGYCGSFVQCQLLKEALPARLPDGMMLMMAHAVNPHGFAWQRRVNEDNIDLNRNFIDFSGALPVNAGYRTLAEALEPEVWEEDTAPQLWQRLKSLSAAHENPDRWRQAAMTGGQYEYPHGIFYGGAAPSWSNQQIHRVTERYLKGREVTWIDIHTALGKYGEAECIVEYEKDHPGLARAQSLWGKRVFSTRTGESLSANVAGSMCMGVQKQIGESMLAMGLEYGTVRSSEVLGALIADQWLHRYGDLASPQGQAIKQKMMDAFYPDDPAWREAVMAIAREVVKASGVLA
ncbi:MAG: M14 family metallopeptidase [Gammaproteobacteria bacterium]|nr:M14 family metallopeptidase [Gammaproteobacteria bacterium]